MVATQLLTYAVVLLSLAATLPSTLAAPVSSKRQQVVEMAPTFNTMRKCAVTDGPSPNLHLLLPINKGAAGKNLCKTVLSSIVQGYKPIIINWESTTTNRELLQLEKVSAVADFLNSDKYGLTPQDLVLMVDALDVWMQLPKEHLIARFMEVEGGRKVVAGADKVCWPNDEEGPVCQGVPDSTMPKGAFGVHPTQKEYEAGGDRWQNRPKFANSGTVMGNVVEMRKVYQTLQSKFENTKTLSNPTDQGIFNELLADREITLDYWYRMFYADASDVENMQVMNIPNVEMLAASPLQPKADLPCAVLDSASNPPFEVLPALFTHKKTGQIPAVMHFNDYWHKDHINELWGTPWFSSQESRFRKVVLERLRNGVVHFDHSNSDVRYMDLCPSELLDLSVLDDKTGL